VRVASLKKPYERRRQAMTKLLRYYGRHALTALAAVGFRIATN